MKKIISLLTIQLALHLLILSNAHAAPGDTTWVTVFENKKIDHYGNFDTSAVFPNTSTNYRKIRMHYILGRTSCPPGTQFCGSWDYTTSVYAMPSNADTVELGRVITPYASDWPLTRKHDYIIEVTDYASILKGNTGMRYIYEGYSWGFTLTLKIEFIEGTPARKALAVENIYDGYFLYGKTADPIESHLISKNFTYNAPATNAAIKNIISGHGMDQTGCGEFCSKYYQQKINGTSLGQKQLWKNDCGLNNVSPQTGTWVFDRANWCPGEAVYPIVHELKNVTSAGNVFSADIDMEPYTSPNPDAAGGYNIASQLITYQNPAHTLDASVEAIISPSNDPNFARFNGACDHPIIKIRNTGSTALTNLKIQYQLQGGQPAVYTWTGNLAFMEEAIVDLGPSTEVFMGNESNIFLVKLIGFNTATTDGDALNNEYKTQFAAVTSYPNKFRVNFKTNAATSISNAPYNETGWKIVNSTGAVVASRINNQNNTTYIDTVSLPTGCYTFIMDDDGCDGIAWWYYANYPTNPGSGQARFIRLESSSTLKSFSGDFGCQVKERFTVDYTLNVNDLDKSEKTFDIYPNPAKDNINIQFFENLSKFNYQIVDITGKVIQSENVKEMSNSKYTIDTSDFKSGIYFIQCNVADNQNTVTNKFIINR